MVREVLTQNDDNLFVQPISFAVLYKRISPARASHLQILSHFLEDKNVLQLSPLFLLNY